MGEGRCIHTCAWEASHGERDGKTKGQVTRQRPAAAPAFTFQTGDRSGPRRSQIRGKPVNNNTRTAKEERILARCFFQECRSLVGGK